MFTDSATHRPYLDPLSLYSELYLCTCDSCTVKISYCHVVSISWPAVNGNGTKGGQHRQSSLFFSYKIAMPKVRLGDSNADERLAQKRLWGDRMDWNWPEYGPMTGCVAKTQTYCDLRLSRCLRQFGCYKQQSTTPWKWRR